ncbi:hypothetical protein ADK90_11995 [Streptomyces sp. XY413]|nr:hypothetical protein ADK90_11995 [Streptomyces sp. XY413]
MLSSATGDSAPVYVPHRGSGSGRAGRHGWEGWFVSDSRPIRDLGQSAGGIPLARMPPCPQREVRRQTRSAMVSMSNSEVAVPR